MLYCKMIKKTSCIKHEDTEIRNNFRNIKIIL